MTLIDGDKIVTANLYDDQCEEFIEKKMSIIDFVNTYTDEGLTTADDVLDNIKAEIAALSKTYPFENHMDTYVKEDDVRKIIEKYMAESEDKNGKL